jgi:uncharacterized protein YutE (UPF0331/DUF86 family)
MSTKPTKEQNLKKLELLAEQMRKHCEKHNLQCFVYHEAPDHQVALSQHCSEDLLVNIAAHLGLNHPQTIVRAKEIMIKIMGIQKTQEAGEGTLVLGIDGKPLPKAEA